MYKTRISSPIGNLIITSDGSYLTGLYIQGQKYFLEEINHFLEKSNLDILI